MKLCELSTLVSRSFRKQDDVNGLMMAACIANADLASCEEIGRSEEGRPLLGITLGTGDKKISLLAGAHADEPVGPETLRTLVLELLHQRAEFADLLSTYTFKIVTHVNPDGEIRNRKWTSAWPNIESYLQHAARELPGRDIEFCFPKRRPENRAVSEFLGAAGPYRMHMSLHGMGFAEGAMLLIDRLWAGSSVTLQREFEDACVSRGLSLHDHNRKGEKGFFYIDKGFTTTPEGRAMSVHFQQQGDEKTAAGFGFSSMEFVQSLGGTPLCLVTEVPLYTLRPSETPGLPSNYIAWKKMMPRLQTTIADGKSIRSEMTKFDIAVVHIEDAAYLQLRALEAGLDLISGS